MGDMTEMRTYLAAVKTALAGVPARDRDAAVAELEANLRADIARRGDNPAAVAAALADLGGPEQYAAAVRESLEVDAESPQPQGRVLGMPYEFRAPSAGRIMERLWNPADPRIIMPRTWGVGWTINFGAVAVRMGLVRPDDVETRPFENLSAGVVRLVVTVPLVLGALATALTVAFWSRLPEQVPTHFDAAGVADGWGSKPITIGALVVVAAGVPVVVLIWQRLRSASRGNMAITGVALTFASLLATIILGYTIANAVYDITGWWLGVVILAGALVPGVMFYVLAVASLKQEWRAAAEPRGQGHGEDVR